MSFHCDVCGRNTLMYDVDEDQRIRHLCASHGGIYQAIYDLGLNRYIFPRPPKDEPPCCHK